MVQDKKNTVILYLILTVVYAGAVYLQVIHSGLSIPRLPVDIIVIATILYALYFNERFIIILAFIAGLTVDSYTGIILGTNSLILLLMIFITQKTRAFLYKNNPFFQILLILTGSLLYRFVHLLFSMPDITAGDIMLRMVISPIATTLIYFLLFMLIRRVGVRLRNYEENE
ncbi:MAG: rod shape-determining protein MreD [bacterium]